MHFKLFKKGIATGVFVLVIIFLLIITISSSVRKTNEKPHSSDLVKPNVLSDSTIGDYMALMVKVENPNKLKLISNLKLKNTSDEVLESYSCNSLVSGGFYSPNGHIGYFVSNGKILSQAITSNLFNGFLSISENGEVKIGTDIPEGSPLALQSGPLLFHNGQPTVKLSNEKKERRVVAIKAKNSANLYFAVFYSPKNASSGPALNELPQLITELSEGSSFVVESALNLDGGLHSVFINNSEKVKESLFSGSFFCF